MDDSGQSLYFVRECRTLATQMLYLCTGVLKVTSRSLMLAFRGCQLRAKYFALNANFFIRSVRRCIGNLFARLARTLATFDLFKADLPSPAISGGAD